MDETTQELLRRMDALEAWRERTERTPTIPSYATLAAAGAAGRAGRVIFVVADGKVYRDTGAAWKSTEIA